MQSGEFNRSCQTTSQCVSVHANSDGEPGAQTHCPRLQASPTALHLAGRSVCVCVCREQLFSSATRGGQRETRTSHSCGPGACGNCGLNNVGEEAEEEEKERSGGESTGTKRKLYKLRQDETAGEEETTPEETETKTEERRETSSVTCLVFSREVTAARRGGGARTAKRFLDAPPSVSTTSLSRPII